jgi:hypothetical protein
LSYPFAIVANLLDRFCCPSSVAFFLPVCYDIRK